ncbi:hypothetical protein BDY17DRAFT_349920 [Neohortaea acidophila]|uniref:F-box domain-containing protein n=1 Tax=Neohortaea acidophila TaxID=245834 RepID=A0A6A6PG19_9PEZI|nr:uncharacterized protein BDY17DRAFT_349920 [Neohortaea acidophila]KAF2478920.1 hypothetical protein BDY17DRAFT_349920 [Neohortaea acidophila]
MAVGFWDLPLSVREKIYRLHLVHPHKIGPTQVHEDLNCGWWDSAMPPICHISRQADREAAPIYYGENHFEFGVAHPHNQFGRENPQCLTNMTSPRHLKLIRKVTCHWPCDNAYDWFLRISRMKGLEELYIGVDEKDMVNDAMRARYPKRTWSLDELSPQHMLAISRAPGMSALLTISGVPMVQFVKRKGYDGAEHGGPIPGGFLETYVRPRLMGALGDSQLAKDRDEPLSFLALPPELRNRVYSFLLEIDGPIHPSNKAPSSLPKCNVSKKRPVKPTESALSILAVNRQIHDEAMGIFYDRNSFEFYYPTQLHAFFLSLGQQRQRVVRDITLHYYNVKCGGINLVDLTLPIVRQLTGLRRLHIVLKDELSKRISGRYLWVEHSIRSANPMVLPGIKLLFSLRNISDIKIHETSLEEDLEELKSRALYPDFAKQTRAWCLVKLSQMLDHVNLALSLAQKGEVNREMMEDDWWHLEDTWPKLIENSKQASPAGEDGLKDGL